jgi:DNA-directed RNA polymerase I subunit RPA12
MSSPAIAVAQKIKVGEIHFALEIHDSDLLVDTASKTSITKTNPANFPSILRQQRSVIQKVERSDMENTAKIQVTCQECGRPEVKFTQVQLRSADEGSTIFYTCDCGHK